MTKRVKRYRRRRNGRIRVALNPHGPWQQRDTISQRVEAKCEFLLRWTSAPSMAHVADVVRPVRGVERHISGRRAKVHITVSSHRCSLSLSTFELWPSSAERKFLSFSFPRCILRWRSADDVYQAAVTALVIAARGKLPPGSLEDILLNYYIHLNGGAVKGV